MRGKIFKSVLAVLLAVVLCVPSVMMPETKVKADSSVGGFTGQGGSTAVDWIFTNDSDYLVFLYKSPRDSEVTTADIFGAHTPNATAEFYTSSGENVFAYRTFNAYHYRTNIYDSDYNYNYSYSYQPNYSGNVAYAPDGIDLQYNMNGTVKSLTKYSLLSDSQKKSKWVLSYYDEAVMRSDIAWYNTVYSYLTETNYKKSFVISKIQQNTVPCYVYGSYLSGTNVGIYDKLSGKYNSVSYGSFEDKALNAMDAYKSYLTFKGYDISGYTNAFGNISFSSERSAKNANSDFFDALALLNNGQFVKSDEGSKVELTAEDIQYGRQLLLNLFKDFGMDITGFTASDSFWFVVVPISPMVKLSNESTNYKSRLSNGNSVPTDSVCYIPGMLFATKGIWLVPSANAFYGGRLTGANGSERDRGAKGYQIQYSSNARFGNAPAIVYNSLLALSQDKLTSRNINGKPVERAASYEPIMTYSSTNKGVWTWTKEYPKYSENDEGNEHYTYKWWGKHTGTIKQNASSSMDGKHRPVYGQGYAAFGPQGTEEMAKWDSYYTMGVVHLAYDTQYNKWLDDNYAYVSVAYPSKDTNNVGEIGYVGYFNSPDQTLGKQLQDNKEEGVIPVEYLRELEFESGQDDGYRTILVQGTISKAVVRDGDNNKVKLKDLPDVAGVLLDTNCFQDTTHDETKPLIDFEEATGAQKPEVGVALAIKNDYTPLAVDYQAPSTTANKLPAGYIATEKVAIDAPNAIELHMGLNSFKYYFDLALTTDLVLFANRTAVKVTQSQPTYEGLTRIFDCGILVDKDIEIGKNSFKYRPADGSEGWAYMNTQDTPIRVLVSVKLPKVHTNIYRLDLDVVNGKVDDGTVSERDDVPSTNLNYLCDDTQKYPVAEDSSAVRYYVYVPKKDAMTPAQVLENLKGMELEELEDKASYANDGTRTVIRQIPKTYCAASTKISFYDGSGEFEAEGYDIYEVTIKESTTKKLVVNSELPAWRLTSMGSDTTYVDGVANPKGHIGSSSPYGELEYKVLTGKDVLGDYSKSYDSHDSRAISNPNVDGSMGSKFAANKGTITMASLRRIYYTYSGASYSRPEFYLSSYLNRSYFRNAKMTNKSNASLYNPVISSMTAYDSSTRAVWENDCGDETSNNIAYSVHRTYNFSTYEYQYQTSMISNMSSVASSYGFGYGYIPDTTGVGSSSVGKTYTTKYQAKYSLKAPYLYSNGNFYDYNNVIGDAELTETYTVDTYIPADKGTGSVSTHKIDDTHHVVSGDIEWSFYPEVEMELVTRHAEVKTKISTDYPSDIYQDGHYKYDTYPSYTYTKEDDSYRTSSWWHETDPVTGAGYYDESRSYWTDSEKQSRAYRRFQHALKNSTGETSSTASSTYQNSIYINKVNVMGVKKRTVKSSYYIVGKYNNFYIKLDSRKGTLMCDTMVSKAGSTLPQIYAGSDLSLSIPKPATVPYVENTNATFYCLSMLDSADTRVHGINMYGIKSSEYAVDDDDESSASYYNKLRDFYKSHAKSYWSSSQVIGNGGIPASWNGTSPKAATEAELKLVAADYGTSDEEYVVSTAEVELTLTYSGAHGTKTIKFPVDMNGGSNSQPVIEITPLNDDVWQLVDGYNPVAFKVEKYGSMPAKDKDILSWSDLSLSSWGVTNSILSSMERKGDSTNKSLNQWYNETARAFCVRRYQVTAKSPIDTGAIMLEDKIPYSYMPNKGETCKGTWKFKGYNYNGDLVVEFDITGADFNLIYGTNEDL